MIRGEVRIKDPVLRGRGAGNDAWEADQVVEKGGYVVVGKAPEGGEDVGARFGEAWGCRGRWGRWGRWLVGGGGEVGGGRGGWGGRTVGGGHGECWLWVLVEEEGRDVGSC